MARQSGLLHHSDQLIPEPSGVIIMTYRDGSNSRSTIWHAGRRALLPAGFMSQDTEFVALRTGHHNPVDVALAPCRCGLAQSLQSLHLG
jgi:hypothetical protein